jgi:hypothetical protein
VDFFAQIFLLFISSTILHFLYDLAYENCGIVFPRLIDLAGLMHIEELEKIHFATPFNSVHFFAKNKLFYYFDEGLLLENAMYIE